MKVKGHLNTAIAITIALLAISGCSGMVNVPERPVLVVDDIIKMSKAEVGSGIIKLKISSTRSHFRLDSDNILMLKEEGVPDDVIKAMLDTDEGAEEYDLERSYSEYDYWFNYYNTNFPINFYGYPYVPYMFFFSSPYATPVYRWSETLGRYYREFPVGVRSFEDRSDEESEKKKRRPDRKIFPSR
ncbi:hypothetical protein ACFL1R_09315 [Candidatus Latescibacterota bacterium]